MATSTLIRHGTRAGYKAEKLTGKACDRCMAANRVFQRQYTKAGKANGLKYGSHDVIDHLDKSGTRQTQAQRPPTLGSFRVPENPPNPAPTPLADPSEDDPGPSLGDRLADRIRDFTVGISPKEEFLAEEDTGYVSPNSEMLDDPGPDWQPAEETDYVINAQGLKVIQDNLGTYLSVVGITVEMIDPYCGPILAQNFDNIVVRWSKVIAHYPKAAELFLQGSGGVIFTWIGALQATWPVLYAIYQHHLARSVMVTPDGRIYNKSQMPNANGQFPDPLQPDFQYSAT